MSRIRLNGNFTHNPNIAFRNHGPKMKVKKKIISLFGEAGYYELSSRYVQTVDKIQKGLTKLLIFHFQISDYVYL